MEHREKRRTNKGEDDGCMREEEKRLKQRKFTGPKIEKCHGAAREFFRAFPEAFFFPFSFSFFLFFFYFFFLQYGRKDVVTNVY
jgi:hypothetical protein